MWLAIIVFWILPWAIVIRLVTKYHKEREMQKYSDGFKVVHVMLSDEYDGDIIEGLRTINDKGDFFRRAARKYLSENRAFNYIPGNQYNPPKR